MAMFPDFALSDISNLFMPLSADEDSSGEIGKLVSVHLHQGCYVFVSVLCLLVGWFLCQQRSATLEVDNKYFGEVSRRAFGFLGVKSK